MFNLYILQSKVNRHFYIGATSYSPLKRLKEHNKGKNQSTRPFRPWHLIYFEEYSTKSEAYKREFFLKSPKGFLEKKDIIKRYQHFSGGVA